MAIWTHQKKELAIKKRVGRERAAVETDPQNKCQLNQSRVRTKDSIRPENWRRRRHQPRYPVLTKCRTTEKIETLTRTLGLGFLLCSEITLKGKLKYFNQIFVKRTNTPVRPGSSRYRTLSLSYHLTRSPTIPYMHLK